MQGFVGVCTLGQQPLDSINVIFICSFHQRAARPPLKARGAAGYPGWRLVLPSRLGPLLGALGRHS